MAKKCTKSFACLLLSLLLFSAFFGTLSLSATTLPTATRDQKITQVYLGGMPFGVKFMTEGVLVVGFCDIKDGKNAKNPSREAGVQMGDVILRVGNTPLCGASELNHLIENSGGAPVEFLCSRNGKTYATSLTPVYSSKEGRYKSGLYVRDSGAGIGTVTYIVPKTLAFGGLGHGICDAGTGELVPMQRGSVIRVSIHAVERGLVGSPGQVKGHFEGGKIGSLLTNHTCGVFGVFSKLPAFCDEKTIPVGSRGDLACGKATIRCTLDESGPKYYEVEISDILRDATSNKCFTVKVTDPDLIAKTGGIVQGMSGSPIIQNGKLVGAVTHVLINDPTTGYGIFIENMLGAAQGKAA